MQITNEAKMFITEQIESNEAKNIKIFLAGMGCCSPQIGLSLDEPSANDEIVEVNGIQVAIEQQVSSYVTDLTFDVRHDENGTGIVIHDPSPSC
ncbi:hypothetical protein [Salisediminibacterium beveridgei]|uniref:Fe-S cluster assembly iron-binding protein IscA n=1 Tax=Salisediminibacterium beveridgei TaxID=632773 RepID=A0A1D7QY32_9BACI|nr:hypothetical protein [Salisediminibacterium beveridgei]AOM83910.1 hypothetical protein BBEV_2571 [Salisediminibacterium beveridgei]